ncbi:hypothetical protein HPB48_003972 [Haemaphysalis longicornis]|uniref:Uncharacterized protein n=1 Tax=Haemaphysalis longicornis TaxID=44386 RepID=A0A9J6GF09_HAELO|nr:hypothetical protein HPB48_003972 [Haemaphysalis longicornis]
MAPYNARGNNGQNLVLTVIFGLGIAACVIALVGQYNRYRDSRGQEEQEVLEDGAVMHAPPGSFNLSGVASSLVIRGYQLCRAHDCKLEATRLSQVLAGAPCDSFYNYVCSRRWAHNPVAMRSADDVALQDIQNGVWKHIHQGTDRKLASVIWKSCMDALAVDNMGTIPFYDVLNASGLAGWPFREVPPMTNPWHSAGRLARLLDLAALLSVRVLHGAGPTLTIVIGHAETPMSLRDFRFNATTTAFLRRVEDTVSFLAPEENETATRAVEVLNFVLRLVNLNSAKGRASALAPETPFKEFLDAAMGDLIDLKKKNVLIKIKSSKYGRELNRTMTAVSPRSALNYLGFYALDHLRAFSPANWDRAVPAGQRERSCLQMAERAVPSQILEMGYHTYKKRFNITSLRRLTSGIKQRLVDNIRSLSWMEPGMKAKVIDKVHRTSVEMPFPRQLVSTGSLPGGALPLPRNTSGALELYQRAVEYRVKSAILNSKDARPPRSLFSRRIELDVKGVLHVPLAAVANLGGPTPSAFVSLLRGTRLSVRLAKALLEAALGRTADERSVWTPKARGHYQDLQTCFEKQYSALRDPLDGGAMQKPPDVVADDLLEHVAVTVAHLDFRARVQSLRGNLSDYRLADAPGFSSERLFFVSYAESSCQTYDDEWVYREFLARKESPASQRVDMALAHDRTFQRAFRCRRGYRMRPSRTCVVW